MSNVKIYKLTDPITYKVMYVGRTKVRLSMRMSSHYHCSRHNTTPRDIWIASLRKSNLKPIAEVIEDVDELMWREKEKFWIDHYKQINPELTNLAEGGEGPLGVIRTEEFTKTLSEIQSKPVYQLDLNFNILQEYNSCKAAVLSTGITNVGSSARSKGIKRAGRYVWIYKSDYDQFILTEKRSVFKKDYSYLTKIIEKYDKSGKFIESWSSAKLASEQNGYQYSNLLRATRGERKTYKKFIWKFKN